MSLKNYFLIFYLLTQIALYISILSLLKNKEKIDFKTKKIRNDLFITCIVFILVSFIFLIFYLIFDFRNIYFTLPILLNFLYSMISYFAFYKHLPKEVKRINLALAILTLPAVGLIFLVFPIFLSLSSPKMNQDFSR